MMDREFFENSITKMKHRREEGDLKKAVYIADKIDWSEVKDVNLLLYTSMIYEDYKDYDSARTLIEYAYENAPIKARLYYALCNINIKLGDMRRAQSFYVDFCTAFPNDNKRILLKYYFLKRKGADVVQRCRVLEEYVEEEKDEEALFELAVIYEEMKLEKKVVETCEYIVDFFGVKRAGYGRKALELKKKYAELTLKEQNLLMNYIKENNEDEHTSIVYQNISRPNLKEVKEKSEEEIKIEKIKREKVTEETLFKDEEDDTKPKIKYVVENNELLKDKETSMAFMKKEKKKEEKDNEAFNKYRIKSFERKERNMKVEELKQNMIIEAYSREEAFNIATEELLYLHKALGNQKKAAKASAYNINERGFIYYIDKLGDRDLIIESAGQLKNQVIDEIEEFILRNDKKNIIALCDIVNNFDKLSVERPAFLDRFDVYSVLSEKKQDAIDDDDDDIKKTFLDERSKNPIIKKVEPKIERVERNDTRRAPKEMTDEISISDYEKETEEREIMREVRPTRAEKIMYEEDEQENREKKGKNGKLNFINDIIKKSKEAKPKVDINNTKEEMTYEQKRQQIERNKSRDMDVDEFVEYCKKYAKSIDCNMPGKTIPALYERIEMMAEEGLALTEKRAIELIESAADKAEKPKLFARPKYDKEGNLILQEEHFIG